MKNFSNSNEVHAPVLKTTTIASGTHLPLKAQPPSLFYNKQDNQLYLQTDYWNIIPYGDHSFNMGLKSVSNIQVLKGDRLPTEIGGTFLIDPRAQTSMKVALPPSAVVQGITYNLKNIGKFEVILYVANDDSIESVDDGFAEIKLHPKECITIQCYESCWYILNKYL